MWEKKLNSNIHYVHKFNFSQWLPIKRNNKYKKYCFLAFYELEITILFLNSIDSPEHLF